jgi:sugar/nucleoside kinase (ribokinase family)
MTPRYPERGEFDVVHVGNVCRDVAPGDPRGWRLGGGVAYAALTTARLGLRAAAVVGADATAAGAAEFELLRSAGVALRIVPLAHGPVFDNRETSAGRLQVCVEAGEELPVVNLPRAWTAAPAWLVVPVAGETGPGWAAAVPPAARLAIGWQGLLRRLVPGAQTGHRPPAATALLDRADLVAVSRHDVDPGTRLGALAAFLRPGARLVVTEGAGGGVILVAGDVEPGTRLRYRALTAHQVDSTGAGDVFLAALVASGIARHATADENWLTERDVRRAAAAGSLAVEGVGLAAVPDRAAIHERLEREPSAPLLGPTDADGIDR